MPKRKHEASDDEESDHDPLYDTRWSQKCEIVWGSRTRPEAPEPAPAPEAEPEPMAEVDDEATPATTTSEAVHAAPTPLGSLLAYLFQPIQDKESGDTRG